ncbi:MAG: FtsK/SpoIIIE domain-containing protein [Actinomycetota bacterium]|nr:FtsK/SpoIIIE domain-containing protein [Actinomycetota bacterium]
MRILHQHGRATSELDVTINDPDATVADLVRVLDPRAAGDAGIVVDGRAHHPPGRLLADVGLLGGDVVTVTDRPPGRGHDTGRTRTRVSVRGGLSAGRTWLLDDGTHSIGRDADAGIALADDATVSRAHAELTVDGHRRIEIRDVGSRNGTLVDGRPTRGRARAGVAVDTEVRLGATVLGVERDRAQRPTRPHPHEIAPAGTVALRRPPRTPAAPPPEPLALPQRPARSSARTPLGIVAMLLPMVGALGFALMRGDIRYAAFGLFGPLAGLANRISGRRRQARERRRASRGFVRALGALDTDLDRLATAHRRAVRTTMIDPAEAVARADEGRQLWERDPATPRTFRLGTGNAPWDVPVAQDRNKTIDPDVEEVLDRHGTVARCPVTVDLEAGEALGIVGHPVPTHAHAAWLVLQAAIAWGPAHLRIVVLTDDEAGERWAWTRWLPHTVGSTGERLAAHGVEAAAGLARDLAARPAADERLTLVVVDGPALTDGRGAPGRALIDGIAGPAHGLVLTTAPTDLPPSVCSIVRLGGVDGAARLVDVREHHDPTELLLDGIDEDGAERAARRLSRWRDPELTDAAADVPRAVALLRSTGLDVADDERTAVVAAGWERAGADPAPALTLGIGAEGPLVVDLVRDGPHALVAGTTGAGKSELLRSLVAGLAVASPPEHLTFVLVDYKGGAAFGDCERLPHVAGLVTDLDAELAERALRSLRAELERRERVLREVGAPDLTAYRADPTRRPLPRLVVVVDEFAGLAAELPDFLDALVDVAQRGRSLGVHMILATQRPAGVVTADIRANTALRIALRVQDPGESKDVVDVADAATIARSTPGRAVVRLGASEQRLTQTAYASGHTAIGGGAVRVHPVDRFGRVVALAGSDDGPTDLARIVDAVSEAHLRRGGGTAEAPWLPPLPSELTLDELEPGRDPAGAALGRVDEPDHQRQSTFVWRPDSGNLWVIGALGAGTSTALRAAVGALARGRGPDALHVYGIDLGRGDLAPVGSLPHCAAVVGADDLERQARVVARLDAILRARRAGTAAGPMVLLVIDGFAPLVAAWEDQPGSDVVDALGRILAEGPAVGIHAIVSSTRPSEIPTRLQGSFAHRIVLRLVDRNDQASLGIGRVPSSPLPGRGRLAPDGLAIQLARCDAQDLRLAADAAGSRRGGPAPVLRLPDEVDPAELGPVRSSGDAHTVPIGRDGDGTEREVTLRPGEPVLVAGGPRAGVSATLAAIGRRLADAGLRPLVLAGPNAGLASMLADVPRLDPGELPHLPDRLGEVDVLLVDDAHVIDDRGDILAGITKRGPVALVVGGRGDALLAAYGHWTRGVRRSRTALVLGLAPEVGGELLNLRMPRRELVAPATGRGRLVHDGVTTLVQVARPMERAHEITKIHVKAHEARSRRSGRAAPDAARSDNHERGSTR